MTPDSCSTGALIAETYRVLVPGGRTGIAGGPTFAEYRASLNATGFTDIRVTATHAVADGMHSAIIRAPTRQYRAGGTAGGDTTSAVPARNDVPKPQFTLSFHDLTPPWAQRSRTSRGVHERDTQIIIVSPASRSSVVRTESR